MFQAEDLIPDVAYHRAYFEAIKAHVERTYAADVDESLREFLGVPVNAGCLAIRGLAHVAVYIGDYTAEPQIEDWITSLRELGWLSQMTFGPSHIAPRHYGTPGWWIAGRVSGFAIEMFSCRRFGSWADRPIAERVGLMSHSALAMTSPELVSTGLRHFQRFGGIRELSFVERDQLGHCYGHLVNDARKRVLELVYSADEGVQT